MYLLSVQNCWFWAHAIMGQNWAEIGMMQVETDLFWPRLWGCFKNEYLRYILELKILMLYQSSWIWDLFIFQCCIKFISFNARVRHFVWNFKGYLWNSTQNTLPIHWKIWFLYNTEMWTTIDLRVCRHFRNDSTSGFPTQRASNVFPSYEYDIILFLWLPPGSMHAIWI